MGQIEIHCKMFRQMPRCRGVDKDLEVGACDLKVTVEVIFQIGSFRTPESLQVNEGLMPTSVESAGGPRQVSEGLMPAAAVKELGGEPSTEGPMPRSTPEAGLRKQSLEQAMGEELVQHLL